MNLTSNRNASLDQSDVEFERRRSAMIQWMDQGQGSIAFTGSARQCFHHASGATEWATPCRLQTNIRHFEERLSRDLLGRSAVRRGRRLTIAGVIEGDGTAGDTRLHVHLMIGGVPDTLSWREIRGAVARRWRSTLWGYHDVDVRPLTTPEERRRWALYLMKEVGRRSEDRWYINFSFDDE